MPNKQNSLFNREIISEFIFEVRYKPSPLILDKRGEWAKDLIKETNLDHWMINENRIDVYDRSGPPDEANERCFISYRNAGWISKLNKNHNKFLENCSKLINFWFSKEEIFPNHQPFLTRVGIKFKYGDEFYGSFSNLLDLYKQKYIKPMETVNDIYKAELTDIGGYLILQDNDIKIQSMSGPMDEQQIINKKFFPFIENSPKTILYFEIDSSSKPNSLVHYKELEKIVDKLIQKNWSSHSQLLKILETN